MHMSKPGRANPATLDDANYLWFPEDRKALGLGVAAIACGTSRVTP